jgi:hypothetical protein
VIKGRTTEANKTSTAIYHAFQKPDLFNGVSRVYTPRDDEGEKLPPETKRVPYTVDQLLLELRNGMVPFFDICAQRDVANTLAKADVVVGTATILKDVPVPHLLFLEKQLLDLGTALKSIPVLDAAEVWNYDENSGVWVSAPYDTLRAKKVPKNHVLAEATDKHPAQVHMYHEDVTVGTWRTVKTSGAVPATRLRTVIDRVTLLQEAVKTAREKANATPLTQVAAGAKIFDFLLG